MGGDYFCESGANSRYDSSTFYSNAGMVKAVVAAVAVAHNSTVLHIYFTKTLPNTTDCVKEDLYSSGVHGTLCQNRTMRR